jgi:hypothetical protein
MKTLLDSTMGFYSAYCFHVETDSYFPGRDFHLSKLHPESNDAYPS